MSVGMANPYSVEKQTQKRAVDPAGELIESPNGWFAGIALTETWLNGSIPVTIRQISDKTNICIPLATIKHDSAHFQLITVTHSYEKNKVKVEANTSDSMKS